MPAASAELRWLRAGVGPSPTGVDRDKKIIRGYTVAQEGPFRTRGRGEFDRSALETIVRLMRQEPNGLKSRFTHPTPFVDGAGRFLGRLKDPRLDGAKVRADLHLDPTSFATPWGDLGGYVMRLAESDPGALSSSLVLAAEDEYRIDPKGRPLLDADGKPLPPLWRPTKLLASDVVDTGDAVDGLLAAGGAAAWGPELLDLAFDGLPWEEVEARCLAWLARYKEHRGVQAPAPPATPALDGYRLRLEEMTLATRRRADTA